MLKKTGGDCIQICESHISYACLIFRPMGDLGDRPQRFDGHRETVPRVKDQDPRPALAVLGAVRSPRGLCGGQPIAHLLAVRGREQVQPISPRAFSRSETAKNGCLKATNLPEWNNHQTENRVCI